MPNKLATNAKKKLPRTPKDLPGHIIAAGGESMAVRLIGKTKAELVTVHLLRAAGYPAFLDHLSKFDDEALVAYVVAKPLAWAARLHPESLQDIKEKALLLNFTAAQKWANNTLLVMEANQKMETAHPSLSAGPASPSSNGSTT